MKIKIFIIFLFLTYYSHAQVVPDTYTFSMTEVRSAVGGDNLQLLFGNAVNEYFDPAYSGAKDRLTNFRNYHQPIEYATVLTKEYTNLGETTVTLNGEVLLEGGFDDTNVIQRGFYYGTDPTLGTYTTRNVGSGLGSYLANITSLTSGTNYYYRAFAINDYGTAIGQILSFKTIESTATAPTVTTGDAININPTTTKLSGNVTNDNGSSVTERGIVWIENLPEFANPTTSIYAGKLVLGSGIGEFSGDATGLTASTSYKYRAYAINSAGTSYGSLKTFTTNSSGPVGACPSVGDEYQGGIVAYVIKFGEIGFVEGECHGLIISKTNLGITATVPWGLVPNRITGADSFSYNKSKYNTDKIVSAYGDGYYAAKLCSDYVSDGYDDWQLPSQNALYLVITFPGLTPGFYWTSSEWSPNTARASHTNGMTGSSDKSGTSHYVRAIRYF